MPILKIKKGDEWVDVWGGATGGNVDIDLSDYATKDEIPTKISKLENDSGFITSESVPKQLSHLENDMGFMDYATAVGHGFTTWDDIPVNVSEFENDAGYITNDALPQINIDDVIEDIEGSVNLYEPTTEGWIDNTIIYADGTTKENNKFCLTPLIPVNPSATYSVGFKHQSLNNVFCYDDDGNYIDWKMSNGVDGDILSYSFTTEENVAYIRFNLSKMTDLETTIANFNSSFILVEGVGVSIFEYGFKTNIREIGNLSELNTEHKDNLVGAINEIGSNFEVMSTSQLINDSGFITQSALPTKVSELENDTKYVTKDVLPTVNIDDIIELVAGTDNYYVPQTDGWVDNSRLGVDGAYNDSEIYCLTPKFSVFSSTKYKTDGYIGDYIYQYDANDNFIASTVLQDGEFTTYENTSSVQFNVFKSTYSDMLNLEEVIENFNNQFKLFVFNVYQMKNNVKLPENNNLLQSFTGPMLEFFKEYDHYFEAPENPGDGGTIPIEPEIPIEPKETNKGDDENVTE